MSLKTDFDTGYQAALRRFKLANALLGYGGKPSPTQSVGTAPPISGATALPGRSPIAAPIAPQAAKSSVL